ncbi:hypothetical protein BDW74DRAFT_180456 [Aspergillus multicolor]|uniref:uncharacterized protein n=1 Tax=Aspergillus multicolor TaxID=41759 RepID=UPI003CCD425A
MSSFRAVSSDSSHPLHEMKHVLESLEALKHGAEIAKNILKPPPRQDVCIDQLISTRCHRQPSAPAVCAWDGALSYRELNDVSSQLAVVLSNLGAGPGSFIPVCLKKSKWTAIAILGVLKAGAAFLLLDPSHPPLRLRQICLDVRARIVITSSAAAAIAASLGIPTLVNVDDASTWPSQGNLPAPIHSPSSPAYAVFTSGSTGKAKGVVIDHAAFATAAHHFIQRTGLGAWSRVFQFASYAFDVSIADHLATLIAGGCVCIPSEDDRVNRLPEGIRELESNWVDLTPSVARLLAHADVPTLQTLVLAGEPMSKHDITTWTPHVDLINHYGPAECAIGTSILSPVNLTSAPGDIGYAMGCVSWIVDPDDHNRLVPFGEIGELLIEGHIVARGYLHQEPNDSSPFIPPPTWLKQFRSETSAPIPLYKTGDLVHYTADGSVQYIGRKDHLAKIRGQRVQPEEVEYHIRKCMPTLKGVCVDTIHNPEGDSTLVAFVMEGEGCGGNGPALRPQSEAFDALARALQAQLAAILPSYMVPTFVLLVTKVPLTSGGKIDRRALKALVSNHSTLNLPRDKEGLPTSLLGNEPVSANETILRDAWGEALGRNTQSINRDDNFVSLGGNSMRAMHLVSAARKRGLELTVAKVFSASSLSSMASLANPTPEIASRCPPLAFIRGEKQTVMHLAAGGWGIDANEVEDVYPCTPLQEGLMALSIQNPGSYVSQHVFCLAEGVEPQLVEQAWHETIKANPILRTRMVTNNSGTLQVVLREGIAFLPASNLELYLMNDRKRPMGLGQPLVRLCLVSSSYCVLTLHHTVYDGVSLRLVMEHFNNIYHGTPVHIPPPFANFIAHIQQQDDGQQFWRSYLSNCNTPIFPALPSAGFVPNASAHFIHRVLDISQNNGITTSNTIRLALALMISHYLNSEDVVFGVTVNGRAAAVPGIDQMTGPTIATVPFRFTIDPKQDVLVALKRVQDEATSMIPFEQAGLQYISKINEDAAMACQFQTHLVVQPSTVQISQEILIPEPGRCFDDGENALFASYALLIVCTIDEKNRAVDIAVNYDPRVLSNVQVRRFTQQFRHVIQQLQRPAASMSLAQVDCISPKDLEDLRSWNADLPVSCNECLHEMVLKKCASQPSTTAVSSWDGDLTYAELDHLSAAFACRLRELGVELNTMVPFCLDRCKWVVVAILSILRAGGTCPQSGKLPTVSPSDPAFIVFTSGSTGKPKGIIVEHRNLATCARDQYEPMGYSPSCRILHFASYAFDLSIYETVITLVFGGCVCVPSEDQRLTDLAGCMRQYRINWTCLTPSSLRLFRPEDVPDLKTFCIGGESLTQAHVDAWASKVRFINSYGPAETCFCTAGVVDAATWKPGDVGAMFGGLAWVTAIGDPAHLAPIGAIGELVVEGPAVARGYLNNEELTRAGFIEPPPWLRKWRADGHVDRLYRTGDLVQYGDGGIIRFIGRRDTQVKLRGQRVELSEAEYHLQNCFPGCKEVVAEVVVPRDAEARAMLVSFVYTEDHGNKEVSVGSLCNGCLNVPTEAFKRTAATVLGQLRGRLPVYMVPAVVFPLSRVPLTGTGKINRRELRQVAADLDLSQINTYISDAKTTQTSLKRQPNTALECALHSIWAQVLNVDAHSFGIDDDFFHLGGDSISAMQSAAKAKAAGLGITAATIVAGKTIAGIVSASTKVQTVKAAEVRIDIAAPFSPSPIQQLFFDTIETDHNYFNQSFSLRVSESIETERLDAALRAVVKHHAMLRARFHRDANGAWTQRVQNDVQGSYILRSHMVETIKDKDASNVVFEAQRSLDIFNGPLLRADLISTPFDGQYLFLLAHHLVMDLVSWRIILTDLEECLRAETRNRNGDLLATAMPSLPFPTWCALQSEYGRVYLSPEKVSPGPIDNPSGVPASPPSFWGHIEDRNTWDDIASLSFSLSPGQTASLYAQGTPPLELYHAALLASFTRSFSSREPPIIYIEGHGRETSWNPSLDISRTVGWFTTLWPCPVACPSTTSLKTLLKAVHDAHATVPFNGWGHFTSRFTNAQGKRAFGTKEIPEIVLNYSGLYQQLERPGALLQATDELDGSGSDIVDSARRFALIEVSVGVKGGCVVFDVVYNRHMSVERQGEIKQWVELCKETLEELGTSA